uniref:SAP domain containing ribonucleoprotein n=1 Tax=Accipiter nisus TaxID=211598 RepID=A0A8B9NT02_9AVES
MSWRLRGGFLDGTSQGKVPAAALPLPVGTAGCFSLSRLCAAGLAGNVGALGHHMLSLRASVCGTSFLYPSNFCFFSVGSFLSLLQRMQKRAERFNVPVSLESKKAARAARFGLATVSTKGLSADSKPTVNMDKLKERAQRFGLNVSSLSKKSEEDEKLKKRKERFGIVTSSAGAGATEDTEVKPFSKQMESSRGC